MVSCRLENSEQEWKIPACENFIMGGNFVCGIKGKMSTDSCLHGNLYFEDRIEP